MMSANSFNPLYQAYADRLSELKGRDQLRQFKAIRREQAYVWQRGASDARPLLDLSSNDYLGLASDAALMAEFSESYPLQSHALGSTSSRLLTGDFTEHQALERLLAEAFGRSVLVFNSGYHANLGILPALADEHSLIVSDELIHASMIDGIRLSKAQRQRFAHQDYDELARLLAAAQADEGVERVFVVVESVYSMDGDTADLRRLVQLKARYPKTLLYVDEAHGIGVFGERGLGVAEAQGVLSDIDFFVGAFGKALASVGGYVVCEPVIREYLINTMRPLIFSTNLPPINAAWTAFVFKKMLGMRAEREHLQQLSARLRSSLQAQGLVCPGDTHIVPVVYGANAVALQRAEAMQAAGFYVLPIRYPTVAQGQARVRLSLHAGLAWETIEPLLACC